MFDIQTSITVSICHVRDHKAAELPLSVSESKVELQPQTTPQIAVALNNDSDFMLILRLPQVGKEALLIVVRDLDRQKQHLSILPYLQSQGKVNWENRMLAFSVSVLK